MIDASLLNINQSSLQSSSLQSSSLQRIKPNPYAESSTRSTVSPSSVLTISPEAKLADIGSRYDVTNISKDKMGEMTAELLNNKLISSKDALGLMEPEPSSLNVEPDVKFDLLSSRRNALIFAKAHGASEEEIKNRERVIDTLEELQELLGIA